MAKIRVGKPDVRPDATAHVKGVPQGNATPIETQPGHNKDGTVDARRSTGVNPRTHDPIMKEMPNLPPG